MIRNFGVVGCANYHKSHARRYSERKFLDGDGTRKTLCTDLSGGNFSIRAFYACFNAYYQQNRGKGLLRYGADLRRVAENKEKYIVQYLTRYNTKNVVQF